VSGWKITKATPADAAALARILGNWIRETGWMPVLHSREDEVAFLSGLIGGQTVRVARDEAGPLGFLARRHGDVDALYLAPTARGRGIGAALLDEVKATEAEITLWTFQDNTAAIAFYLKQGFVEVERTDGSHNDERLPDVRMIWRRGGG
jgi:ribosomal protein S18 acetylase RimI-like enzyme